MADKNTTASTPILPMQGDAIDKVADLARKSMGVTFETVKLPEDVPGLPKEIIVGLDPRNNTLLDLKARFEPYRVNPERRSGTANINTLQSFIDLVNYHKLDNSAIFAKTDWPEPSLTAVINYHEGKDGKPQFRDHIVSYDFPITDEFTAWAGQNGQSMAQVEFAAFIEEHIADLATASDQELKELEALFQTKMATPADMFALSRGLEVRVAGTVKNSTRLSSGETSMVFEEEHLDAKGTAIVIPGLFMVNIPAFIDGENVRLPARLRYRVGNGKVVWFYQLYKWTERLRERVSADLDKARSETGLPTYEGSPE